MRKCPDCDEQTGDDGIVCEVCGYADLGWQQNLLALSRWMSISARPSRFEYTIPITSFVDSQQLAFELMLFERGWREYDAAIQLPVATVQRASLGQPLLRFNFRPMEFDWNSSVITDDYTGDILPASVGVTALLEAHRAIEVAKKRWQNQVCIEIMLPPSSHPVSNFLEAANLIPPGVPAIQARPSGYHSRTGSFGALETIVPVCRVTTQTVGQLPNHVYRRLDELARVGKIDAKFQSPLRKALMELVDNGYKYGNQECTVAVFLRNEATPSPDSAIRLPLSESAVKQVHLYMYCYTTGQTFAQARGMDDEREALASALDYKSTTSTGGGRGLGGTLCRARDRAEGTILVSSGRYTRIDMPNRIIREWTSESGIALPGVLTCLLIPLANVASVAHSAAS